jgi:Tfp pilus assembly protein PilO
MNQRILSYLGAMPARGLNLAACGALLIAAALLFAVLRPALAELSAMRAERIRHQQTIAGGAVLSQINEQLGADVDRLSRIVTNNQGTRSAEQTVVYVIGELNRISIKRGVTLSSILPGASRKLMMFDEIPFDIEISGNYPGVIGWLQDMEAAVATLAVTQLDVRRSGSADNLSVKARIAVYQETESGK